VSQVARSAALTEALHGEARHHLLRADKQEDLCFAIWHPSQGRSRTTALVQRLILPRQGERRVHGNASFEPQYFERALAEAAAAGGGLALMHSHPHGCSWQGMSEDDIAAEQGHAAATLGATRFPFVGLTLAGDGAWSARFWERTAPRTYPVAWCGTVRIVGQRLSVSFFDELAPPPVSTDEQVRTVSAWGERAQADLARLKIGIVGAGSVGGIIGESLARTGFEDVQVIDFDHIEKHNLDRLQYATRADVGELKVPVLGQHLNARATAAIFRYDPVVAAVFENEGYRAALDCDVLFSCVDRPWGRHVLNLIAYAHLIPVIDGGIAVRTNRLGKLVAADWRAHTATIGRPCLCCLGQYDTGHVQVERDGYLDDPEYIKGLPKDHPLKTRQNVYAFSQSCASLQMLQMLALTLAPLDQPNPGSQLYHFVGSFMEPPSFGTCHDACLFPQLVAQGDGCAFKVTGQRPSKQHDKSEKGANEKERSPTDQHFSRLRSGVGQRIAYFLSRLKWW